MSLTHAYVLISALAVLNAAWAAIAIRASRKQARRYWIAKFTEVVK